MNPVSTQCYSRRKLAAWRSGLYSQEYREAKHWRKKAFALFRQAYKARRDGVSFEETQQLAHQACMASENWAIAAERFSFLRDLHRESKRESNDPISLTGSLLTSLQSVPADILAEWSCDNCHKGGSI